jgi:hypothetical protein
MKLLLKKRHYQQEHKTEIALKKRHYQQEHKEELSCYKKKHYEEHKEEIILKTRHYKLEHRDEILLKSKEKVTCDCGCIVAKWHINVHKRTQKHKDLIEGISAREIVYL